MGVKVHVYQVSPALTIIEKITGQTFARLFGFSGPHAGGVTVQGGSASNMSSIVIARNTLYPETKISGNGNYQFILFTSAHGHYSVEKGAQALGMGSAAVWSVPVDAQSRMIPSELEKLIEKAKSDGKTPLYVNATAGTTVYGSFDPFEALSAVCKRHNLWLHIDASWGGPLIFSAAHRHKLAGSGLADSLTVNPHKMMNIPITCSFLLGPDLKLFHNANTLPAGYLFHGGADENEIWDLADLTLQCGRKGDALKLALSWVYHGAVGFERNVDAAFENACHLSNILDDHDDFVLVSSKPPPCMQVCFYWAPGTQKTSDADLNTRTTRSMVAALVQKGFMIDFAPGPSGSFFRVVVGWQTRRETIKALVRALVEVGNQIRPK
jgi:glutamate decarboxylase